MLLDLRTYIRLREAEEELADVRAYDTAKLKVIADLDAGRSTTLADYRSRRSNKRKWLSRHPAQVGAKELARLPEEISQRNLSRLAALKSKPRPADVKKLKGRPAWRARVGDHRIIYEIHDRISARRLHPS